MRVDCGAAWTLGYNLQTQLAVKFMLIKVGYRGTTLMVSPAAMTHSFTEYAVFVRIAAPPRIALRQIGVAGLSIEPLPLPQL